MIAIRNLTAKTGIALLAALVTELLTGCTSGTHTLTGTPHSALTGPTLFPGYPCALCSWLHSNTPDSETAAHGRPKS